MTTQARRLVAEGLGTALLVAVVVGSPSSAWLLHSSRETQA
jgi:glycerol uptake facilitator-like aquaporin